MSAAAAPAALAAGGGTSAAPASTVARTTEIANLAAIFEAEVDIAVCERDAIADVAHYLERLASAGWRGPGFRAIATPAALRSSFDLPEAPGRAAVQEDIGWLGELYADLLGCERVGVRMEVLDRAMCPRFHTDRTGVRLLCTYRGAGTEWLEPTGRVGRAAPFDVVLLKGEGWPGREGRGAVHRSPAVHPHEAPRVLIAIDAIW